jgi:F-type H+-transporting ATPase subunit a
MLWREMISEAPSSNEYIIHHLTFLTNRKPNGILDFSAINLDSVFFSMLLAVAFGGLFYAAARRASAGVPTRFQNFVEWLVELVDSQVNDIFHARSRLIGPLALTIFCWVFLFNVLDVVPLDLLPGAAGASGIGHLRIVPSTDLNVVFGLSLTVLVLIISYSVKTKGVVGFFAEFALHPLRIKNRPLMQALVAPFNIVVEVASFLARPVSLALRLYGNMFAGEMVFALIALLTLTQGYKALSAVTGWALIVLQLALTAVWSAFDAFIGLLQAYIFMMLTVIYLSQASEHH